MSAHSGSTSRDVERKAIHDRKLEELHSRLADQIAQLTSGADWQAWLKVAARFHAYSFSNTLLIHAQRPDATRVAGYRAWQSLGRQVQKGQRGIQILAPVTRRNAADSAGEEGTSQAAADATDGDAQRHEGRRVVGWRVAHVWDISQTSGEPLPDRPTPKLLQGQAPQGMWDALVAQLEAAGFTVRRGDCDGANGYTQFNQRVVRVRDDIDDAQALKTLAHELGHVTLHDPGREDSITKNCRGVVEVEAESVAYLLCAHLGVETGDYTLPYVAGWADQADGRDPATVVAATGRRVLGAANSIVERLDTNTARTTHAESAHLAVERPHATVNVAPERLVAMHEQAASWYRSQLLSPLGEGPRAYLEARGLGDVIHSAGSDAPDPWKVGYAPASWTALVERLRAGGFTDSELEAGGFATRTRNGNLVNRFRDRIMLPIRDAHGQVIAFIGRAPDDRDEQTPKYLNSPNTAIYHKADSLFGLGCQDLADRRVILVEGPLDVLAVYAAVPGAAAVAPCGTALTEAHARVLASSGARNIVVAFDADQAGRAATVKAYETLRPLIENPLSARLPDGTDPALLAESNPADLARAFTEGLVPLSDTVIDDRIALWRGKLDSAEGRALAAHDLGALIATMPAADVARQVARTAELIGVLHETMTALVADAISPDRSPMPRPTGVMAMNSARSDLTTQQVAIARTAFSKKSSARWPRDGHLEGGYDRRSQSRRLRWPCSGAWSPMNPDR
jgi:DNA primase catalytic core